MIAELIAVVGGDDHERVLPLASIFDAAHDTSNWASTSLIIP